MFQNLFFPFDFLFGPLVVQEYAIWVPRFCEILAYLLLLISSFTPFQSKKILNMISVILNLLRLVLWSNTICPEECAFSFTERTVLRCQLGSFCSIPIYPYWPSVGVTYPRWKWVIKPYRCCVAVCFCFQICWYLPDTGKCVYPGCTHPILGAHICTTVMFSLMNWSSYH